MISGYEGIARGAGQGKNGDQGNKCGGGAGKFRGSKKKREVVATLLNKEGCNLQSCNELQSLDEAIGNYIGRPLFLS
jgi:hypothetical protein